MLSAKEAKKIALAARKEARNHVDEQWAAKHADDEHACRKYLEILEEAITSEAERGNSAVTFYVPYDNYFNGEVGNLIISRMQDYDVVVKYGEATGYEINIGWE